MSSHSSSRARTVRLLFVIYLLFACAVAAPILLDHDVLLVFLPGVLADVELGEFLMHAYFSLSEISAGVELGVRGEIFCKHVAASGHRRNLVKVARMVIAVCVVKYHCSNSESKYMSFIIRTLTWSLK